MTWEPPPELEEYRIVRPLGRGTMGQVYLAHDTLLDRPVAIKFVGAAEVGPGARERFFTEARAVARLQHPNVVAVHRVAEVRGRPYLVSEYVRGVSLDQVAKPLPWERALRIATCLAHGLASAHRRDVLHRDIKPANVVVGDGDEAKLLDFGLAKLHDAAAPAGPAGALALHADVDATASLPGRPAAPASGSPSQTPADALIGTPLYLAPELWRGEPASPRSDVYALGVLLYELVAGSAPHAGLPIEELARRAQEEDAAPLAERAPALPSRLAELIDDCVSRDPARRPESGEAVCERLAALAAPAPAAEGNPYRGLGTFEAEHRALFFGRAAEARAVIERLRSERVVVVAGDSGAGKSSLCRAGVLPAIVDGALGGAGRWRAATMAPGPRPRAALEAALAGGDDGIVLFVDQLEELLTVSDPDEAAAVAERLAELATAAPRFRLLCSARGDFLGRLAGLPGIGEFLGRALFLLGPLGQRGLREAVIGPARAVGYELEPATVDELVASAQRAASGLPLLQFTLAELWEARDERTRTIPADALARLGGVTGALARHADQVMAALGDGERELAWGILLRLMTAEGTRAVRTRAELWDSPAAARVIERLVRARLLALTDESVEVVHEALFTGWPRLVEWRRAHEEGARLRDQLATAARQWQERGRPRGLLWRDDALAEYQLWRRRWPETPTGVEAAFGDASEAEARRDRRARAALLAVLLAALTAGLLVLFRLDRVAETERDVAERQKRTLLAEQGWQELTAGRAGRALPYLAQALREGDDTPALRFLIAEAARPFAGELAEMNDFRDGLTGVVWSPDGSRIATTCMDGVARIYDGDGRLRLELRGHVGASWSPAWSGDGRRLVTSGPDGTIRLWDTATGGALRTIYGVALVSAAQLDARGERALSVVRDGSVRVWDAASGAQLAVVRVPGNPVAVAALAPDGARVVAGMADGSILAFDAAGRPLGRLAHTGGARPTGLRFTRDGARLVGWAGPTATVWDAVTGATLVTLAGHHDTVNMLELDAAETRIVTAGSDATAKVWDARTGWLLADLVGHPNSVRAARFSPDGKRVVTTGSDNTYRVWDVAASRTELVLETETTAGRAPHASSGAVDAAFSPDGQRLLTASATALKLWRVGREPLLAELAADGSLVAVALSPDERRVVAVGGGQTSAIWDLASGARAGTLDAEGAQSMDVTWSRDGERLMVAAADGVVRLYGPAGGAPLLRLRGHEAVVNRAGFSPDGARVLSAGDDGTARLWDARTGAPLRLLRHPDRVLAAAFSPDGARVATSGWDQKARLWDAASGRLLATLPAATQLLDTSFSPDGRLLACSAHDGEVFIWEVASGRLQLTLQGHTAPVTSVAWSPDSALLATSADDESVRIFDAATGKVLASRLGHRGTVMQVLWTRDGARLVSAGNDGTVRIWDARRDERPASEIVRFVGERIPWRLVDGRLQVAGGE